MPARSRAAGGPAAPTVPALDLHDLEDGPAELLLGGRALEAVRIGPADVSGWNLADLALDECELVELTAHETDLRGSRLTETRLLRPAASALRATDSSWRQVELDGARIGALALDGAHIGQLLIRGGKIDWLSLRGAEVADLRLEDVTLGSLDLSEASATRVALPGSTVEELSLHRARLSSVDLRGLRPGALHGIEGLRGATVDPVTLMDLTPALAEHLGIRVRD